MENWWYTYPAEKYDFVSWDDLVFSRSEAIKHAPNHQPDKLLLIPLQKYESAGILIPEKYDPNVPNHQPVIMIIDMFSWLQEFHVHDSPINL